MTGWQPVLGANVFGNATRFRVWAPEAKSVEVVLETLPLGLFVLDAFARGRQVFTEDPCGPVSSCHTFVNDTP